MLADNMKRLTVVSCKTSDTLLELAAKNDIDGFTKLLNRDSISVDQVGLWYMWQKGSKQVVCDKRTPLMVAAMYGSLHVLRKILSLSRRDVNRSTGDDQTTALHCAASCGSLNAVEVVKLLLAKGADPNLMDANCLRPMDMIVDSPEYPDLKQALHEILGLKDGVLHMKLNFESKREYHVDPSLPKIKNSTYSDKFMMYSFKVVPMVPHVHFSIIEEECPFFFILGGKRKTYNRTRLCNYGTGSNRNVCFFAHNQEELRLLDVKSPSPSGNEMLNWQVLPGSNFHASLFSDQSMFSPRNNLSVFNQFQLMSPQGIEAISPMRARALNLATDYQHGQPHVRSLSLQELGSTSVDPWSRWSSSSGEPDLVVNKKEPDLSWVQSSSLSDQSSFSPNNNLSAFNQLHQQQNIISPFNMNFSLKKAPFGVESMSHQSIVSLPHMSTRNLNLTRSREYVTNPWPSPVMGSSVGPWSKWGSSSGKANLAVKREELGLSWIHSLLDEIPHERAFRLDFEQETDETEYTGRK
ncbi:zinc finger CCCH domain-containing protein 30 [Tanacetum coccineum]